MVARQESAELDAGQHWQVGEKVVHDFHVDCCLHADDGGNLIEAGGELLGDFIVLVLVDVQDSVDAIVGGAGDVLHGSGVARATAAETEGVYNVLGADESFLADGVVLAVGDDDDQARAIRLLALPII